MYIYKIFVIYAYIFIYNYSNMIIIVLPLSRLHLGKRITYLVSAI